MRSQRNRIGGGDDQPSPLPGALGAALKTALFTVLVPGTVALLVPYRILSNAGAWPPRPTGWGLIGALPAALGVVLYLWCAGAFALVGRGTPSPTDPPKTLVASGPYRWVRNPMYLSVLLVVCGESLLARSWGLLGYAGALWVLFHMFVIGYEEPALRAAHGEAYDVYRAAVPRWIPRRPGIEAGGAA